MSSMTIDVRAGSHEAHPRGKGFRILSQMARAHADDGSDYTPRHRRDVPVDQVDASIAS
jgi:hypothetical protein